MGAKKYSNVRWPPLGLVFNSFLNLCFLKFEYYCQCSTDRGISEEIVMRFYTFLGKSTDFRRMKIIPVSSIWILARASPLSVHTKTWCTEPL
ncbi:hypothetical protein CEXT_663771 [Caerostris extrusa]|uniref:Uncharacterized protein n=1 Tax=Caerostris extrusa TaxID=172846 RepID=A0AAV4T4H3_CAEEX|nr:hypothetical protein CEXT_663771 [Caerostris extrusa]